MSIVNPRRGRSRIAVVIATIVLGCALPSNKAVGQDPRDSHGATITLRAGDDLQTALRDAQPGDTIVLEAGATFIGPFSLPEKAGSDWITVQSSALASLPAAGQRVSPAHASLMPRLVSPGFNQPVLGTAVAAHHYRFIGIEFTKIDEDAIVNDLITLGDGTGEQDTLDEVPHHLVLDRCYLHGTPASELKRGVALNSADTDITGCYIADCKGAGYDTQAICGWNGPGPFRIENNYLEGAGENVMFGGADPSIPNLVPADITIRGNHFTKPLLWQGQWTVKNLLELKNARRVVIDGNVFEYNWEHAQSGYAILIKSTNQDGGAPWCVTEDVTFTNNIVRHSGGGISLVGYDGTETLEATKRIRIANNLFEDLDEKRWGGDGVFLKIGGVDDVVVEHNTVLQTGSIISAHSAPCQGFVFQNNIAPGNRYGVKGDGRASGADTLDQYFPGHVWAANVITSVDGTLYPTFSFYPASLAAVGFVSLASRDYRLSGASPYRGAGTDGRDIGCDIAALAAPGP